MSKRRKSPQTAPKRQKVRDVFVARPFEGLADEPEWIALRELVPAASAALTLKPEIVEEYGDRPVTLSTVLPMAWPAMTRQDGRVFIGLQRHVQSGDVSRDLAVAILSALGAGELAAVIARRETARLTAIPGVGKKTAERLVLELKDKLVHLPSAPLSPAAPPPTAPSAQQDLLHSALTRMGYRPAEAERAITTLGARVDSAPLGDLVRDALALLSK